MAALVSVLGASVVVGVWDAPQPASMTTAMLIARKNATIFFILCAPLFLFYAGDPGTSYGFMRAFISVLIPVVYQSVFRLRKRLRFAVQKMQSPLTFGFFLCILLFYTRFLTDSRLTREADSTTDSGIPVPPLWVWCSISWMLRRPISYMG